MINVDELWPALLELRELLRDDASGECRSWSSWHFRRDGNGYWRFRGSREAAVWSCHEDTICCDLRQPLTRSCYAQLGIAGRYLDCLWQQRRCERRRPLTTACFAQSLDGFIATAEGDSQWIGNEDNLVHAHRLRALHDGILIGRRTLTRDAPQLTVREVQGYNPLRVVITRRREPDPAMLRHIHKPTLLVKPPGGCDARLERCAPVQVCAVEKLVGDEYLCPAAVLATLRQRGIRSLMIEGGGATLSQFYQYGLLDAADIQVAPMLLGDGVRPLVTAPTASIATTAVHAAQTITQGSQVLLAIRFSSGEDPHA